MNKNCLAKSVLILAFVGSASALALTGFRNDGVERGKYLVREVAQCGECHTPRDDQGQVDMSRWLQGAAVWFRPVRTVPEWAYSAPPLAGLGSFTKDQILQILEKGLDPQGVPVRPPMHRYHLAPEDAEAIVAYLQSLE